MRKWILFIICMGLFSCSMVPQEEMMHQLETPERYQPPSRVVLFQGNQSILSVDDKHMLHQIAQDLDTHPLCRLLLVPIIRLSSSSLSYLWAISEYDLSLVKGTLIHFLPSVHDRIDIQVSSKYRCAVTRCVHIVWKCP